MEEDDRRHIIFIYRIAVVLKQTTTWELWRDLLLPASLVGSRCHWEGEAHLQPVCHSPKQRPQSPASPSASQSCNHAQQHEFLCLVSIKDIELSICQLRYPEGKNCQWNHKALTQALLRKKPHTCGLVDCWWLSDPSMDFGRLAYSPLHMHINFAYVETWLNQPARSLPNVKVLH